VTDRIDVYLNPRSITIDTGYQNPHYGHYCTHKSTGVDLELLTDEERKALAVVDAVANERKLEVAVHRMNGLLLRARLLARGVVRTPAVFVDGAKVKGPLSMEKLERALEGE
jgi:hypothetical protein